MTTVMEALYEQGWFKQPAFNRRGAIMNCYPALPHAEAGTVEQRMNQRASS